MLLYLAVAGVAWFVAAKTVRWKPTWLGAVLGFVFGTVAAFAFSWIVIQIITSDYDATFGPDLANRLRNVSIANLAKFIPVMAGFAAYWSLRGAKRPYR